MTGRGKKSFFGGLSRLLLPVVIVAVVLCFLSGVSSLERRSSDEGKRQLEASIRRCAAACYAVEGVYPPTLAYMQENYGLQIDEDRYFVDYQIFASNLAPTFTVLDVAEKGGR